MAGSKTRDSITIHLEASREELQETYKVLAAQFGPQIQEVWKLIEVPATWACDGRDGCLVAG